MGKILITGASGYVGSSLTKYFLDQGRKVIGLRRSIEIFPETIKERIDERVGELTDKNFLTETMCEDVDVIFHLAGQKGYQQSAKNLDNLIEGNLLASKTISEAANIKNIRIIFASTYWVYGPRQSLPYQEKQALMPAEPYGYSKALAEEIIKNYGAHWVIARFSNIFGFGLGFGFDEAVSLFLQRALKGENIVLANAGEHKIDLICLDDLIEALDKIYSSGFTGVINVGSGRPIKIKTVAELANKISARLNGKQAEIILEQSEKNEIAFTDRYLNVEKLKSVLNFETKDLESNMEILARKIIATL